MEERGGRGGAAGGGDWEEQIRHAGTGLGMLGRAEQSYQEQLRVTSISPFSHHYGEYTLFWMILKSKCTGGRILWEKLWKNSNDGRKVFF